MRFSSTIVVLLLFAYSGYSQSILNNLKSDEEKGNDLYESHHYDEAILHYLKVVEKEPDNTTIKLQIAVCYNLLDDWKTSRDWFSAVEEVDSIVITESYAFQYGDVLHHLGKFEEAKLWYLKAQGALSDTTTVSRRLHSISNLKEYYKDSTRYYVAELPFNTDAPEFSPLLYRGGLIFTSYASQQRKKIPSLQKDVRYDMYYFPLEQSYKDSKLDGQFNQINSIRHDGTLAIYNNSTQMIFTRNNLQVSKKEKKKGYRVKNLGLYNATYDSKSNVWTKVESLTLNNTEYSVGHPTISKDGKTLYFVSDMPGGFGGTDIYRSVYRNDTWTTPINLGASINSDANELFPYLHQDSILYFASEGHPGLGGLDIYKITIAGNKKTSVENLGYPINSSGDDFGIILSENNLGGFFTSNRQAEVARDNIYRFSFIEDYLLEEEVASEVPEKKWLTLQGIVVDKEDKSPLSNAAVMVVDLESRKVNETLTDSLGWFEVEIEVVEGYYIRAEKEEYYTYKASIPYDTLVTNKLSYSIELEKIEVGQKFVLDNIYYDFGAYEVTEEASKPLNQVVEFLQDNPEIKIELSSHTDSRGSDDFNIALSQKRAKSAAEYIISQGIDISRIKATGYGETRLVFPCGDEIDCNEEQHMINRRTEMTILEH